MKKLSVILAALVLVLLCGCAADPAPAQEQDEPQPAAAEPVRVATFTADILSAGSDMLLVTPEPGSFADASATAVAVQLADGLVPTGADGWPIAVSELSPELCVDITVSKPGQLQIILIDGAERLDKESREKLYAKCKTKGLQLIATRVTDSNVMEVTDLDDDEG